MRSFEGLGDRHTAVAPRRDERGVWGPSLLLGPTGQILCGASHMVFTSRKRQSVFMRSADRGRTWSEPQVLHEREGLHRKGYLGGSLCRLSDGRLVLSNIDRGIVLRFSDDEGATWSDRVIVDRSATVPLGSYITRTPSGDLILVSRAPIQAEADKYVRQYRSRDGGWTWSAPETIAQDPVLNWTEPNVVALPDGRLMVLMRENSYNFFPCFKMFSHDEGKSWTQPRPTPLMGHQVVLGELRSGRLLVTYRHMGGAGYTAAAAWVGDADEDTGFEVPATVCSTSPPDLVDGALRIRAAGGEDCVQYYLHPPQDERSTILLEAEVACGRNDVRGCGIHVAQAGWVVIHADHVELPDCGGLVAPVDGDGFHRYRICRTATEMTVAVDGEPRLQTDQLHRGRVVHNVGGRIRFSNVNSFGTVGGYDGGPARGASGESQWRSLHLSIRNELHDDYEWRWDASSGRLPNQYEVDRILEIDREHEGNPYFIGQTAWVEFPDGEIFVVTNRSFLRPDGYRSSSLHGCRLREEDFS